MRLRRDHEVYSITAARTGTNEDVDRRTQRYLLSMGIRTVCFVGAVLVSGPMRWVLLVGALVLPYIAVVVANAGREPNRSPGPDPVPPVAHPAIVPPADSTPADPAPADRPPNNPPPSGPQDRR